MECFLARVRIPQLNYQVRIKFKKTIARQFLDHISRELRDEASVSKYPSCTGSDDISSRFTLRGPKWICRKYHKGKKCSKNNSEYRLLNKFEYIPYINGGYT